MTTLMKFLKQPLTYVGIVSAIAFQLIFFTVWMTAYDGVEKRFDQLSISIVNNDAELGKDVVNNLLHLSLVVIVTQLVAMTILLIKSPNKKFVSQTVVEN